MTTLRAFLIAALLCAAGLISPSADAAFVQRNQCNVGVDPGTCAFDSNVTAGSALVACIRLSEDTVTIDGVSDNQNSAWSLLAGPFTDATTNQRVAVYGVANAAAGATTVSVDISAVETTRVIIAEYSGRATSSVVDGTPANSGFTGVTTTVDSGNTTTAQAGSDLFGCLAINSSGVAFTASGTLTEITETDGDRIGAGSADNQAAGTHAFTGSLDTGQVHISIVLGLKAAVVASLEQEGFRWGVDDGSESAHTFEAAQDTSITIADTQSRLLRVLVDSTLDTASTAYTLRYQKNGSGGYVAVPVGSTTAGAGISNQNVAASADDAQDIGGTVTLTGTTIGASLDASTEWVGMRFTNISIPAGSTITAAALEVVPSGTGEDEPNVLVFFEDADDCVAFTTGASDISNRARTGSVAWASTDLGANGSTYFATPDLASILQTVINRAGWASGQDVCVIIQGGQGAATRDLTIEAQDLGPNTNPPRLDVSWTTPNEVYVTTSANITAGGEATTARLTAPSGKTTGDFVTGRRWDDENGTDSIDITTDDYTEVEWLTFIAASAANDDFFDFRVYAGAAALDTYTVTPRWTIPGAGLIHTGGFQRLDRAHGPHVSVQLGGLLQ